MVMKQVSEYLFGASNEANLAIRGRSETSSSNWSQWTTSTLGPNDDATPAPQPASNSDDAAVSLHPLPSREGLLVKIQPPKAPKKRVPHVPCDIVLVIDVSGSMGCNAPVPANPGDKTENFGLSVLDLTKHAARTILETMDETDRLGIVTFASQAKVVQKLIPMKKSNKVLAAKNIDSMRPIDATNLWHGILEGLKLFNSEAKTGRVPALMVLTDGMPNHMCPAQGYVPKIRSMEELPASIHTFGFGYHLRSGLLKSIAEIGGGNYAFIPDAGMIGTVFVHAVANLQSTYANNATLRITYPSELQLEETTGDSVEKQVPVTIPDEKGRPTQMTISLGNIQYGQSRDIYLRYKQDASLKELLLEKGDLPKISTVLTYSRMTKSTYRQTTKCSVNEITSLSEAEIAYHVSRSAICAYISSIIPLKDDGEHMALSPVPDEKLAELTSLTTNLPCLKYDDVMNKSLADDLCAPEPKGQITLALTNFEFYGKWGTHYLPSLLNAYTRQICNSFKDSGPLQYGVHSPLFIACREKLDAAFDALPAPRPSNHTTYRGHVSMSMYNNASGVCFAAATPVLLASGQSVPIRSLRRGVAVKTPAGPRRVVAVLKTPVRREIMCRVGELIVTPWHPISTNGKSWVFPAQVAERPVRYTGSIYSILLQPDRDCAAHALNVAGMWGVTLGHGLTTGRDIRAHAFFGDYASVVKSLRGVGVRKNGVAVGGGAKRDARTGYISGFKAPTRSNILRQKALELAA